MQSFVFFPQIGHEPVFVDDQEDGVSASCLLACVCERVHLCLLCLFLHSLSRPRSLNKRRAVRANGIFLCVFCVPLSPDCAFFSSQFALSLFSLFFLVVVCILFFLGVSFCWLFVILLQVPNFNFRSRGQSRSRHRHPFPSLLLLIRNLPAGYRCSRAPRPK